MNLDDESSDNLTGICDLFAKFFGGVVYTPLSNINSFVIPDFLDNDIIEVTDDDIILGIKTLKIKYFTNIMGIYPQYFLNVAWDI